MQIACRRIVGIGTGTRFIVLQKTTHLILVPICGAAYAPPIESEVLVQKILGVVARGRSTSRLVNPCDPWRGVAKRLPSVKWNLSQGPMLALRERSVAILATEWATLIVVYTGVSLFYTRR